MLNKLLQESVEIATSHGYMDKLKILKQKILAKEYCSQTQIWSNGADLSIVKEYNADNPNLQVVTTHTKEYSWIVFELSDIYEYDANTKYDLFPTIGTIMNLFQKQYPDDIENFLYNVMQYSTLWLHPKHLGELRFLTDSEEYTS